MAELVPKGQQVGEIVLKLLLSSHANRATRSFGMDVVEDLGLEWEKARIVIVQRVKSSNSSPCSLYVKNGKNVDRRSM